MNSYDPGRQLITAMAALLVVCYVARVAYELVRPALPFLIVVGVVAGIVRAVLWWRHGREMRW